jgi:hypothetical protein
MVAYGFFFGASRLFGQSFLRKFMEQQNYGKVLKNSIVQNSMLLIESIKMRE